MTTDGCDAIIHWKGTESEGQFLLPWMLLYVRYMRFNYRPYRITHFSILRVWEEKFTPILKSLRGSFENGRAYCLSSICLMASSALPSSLNSIT